MIQNYYEQIIQKVIKDYGIKEKKVMANYFVEYGMNLHNQYNVENIKKILNQKS